MLLTILSVFFVTFTDKQGCSPIAFSDRAVEQRTKWAIPTDSLDYAVSTTYTDSVRALGGKLMHVSRWMNGATVECEDSIANKIAACSFVKAIEQTRNKSAIPQPGTQASTPAIIANQIAALSMPHHDSANQTSTTTPQLTLFNLPPLHQAGFRGEDIQIAVIDGGFQNYPVGEHSGNSLSNTFDTAHWLGSYDFTDDTTNFYGATGYHGTMCLSLIAADCPNTQASPPAKKSTFQGDLEGCPGAQASPPAFKEVRSPGRTKRSYPNSAQQDTEENTYLGAAPAADYYLIRSEEEGKESPKEMDNLVAALEKADSLGVNIASISLGYSVFDNEAWDFGYADMNGQTTRCSQAAQIAARKGMLVCVAAGNEGNKEWHYLTAPADADSILCVGAVDSEGTIAAFSSRGPSSDGRVKPDVCAVGSGSCIIRPSDGTIQYGNGTSFACPLIAGMAACIWSALPDLNAMEIRRRIICSADRYHYPDADYGYGIPNAWLAYLGIESTTNTTQNTNTPHYQKIYRNGTLFILRDGQWYDVMGRKVRLR